MNVIKAPEQPAYPITYPTIFLAGSIEQDKAERWQDRFVKETERCPGTIFNPRRNNWDPTLSQTPRDPQFREQVMWELDHMERADYLFFYFSPGTRSPVTLMEFGFHAGENTKHIIVCCPEGFWRKGNIDLLCERKHITLEHTWENALDRVKWEWLDYDETDDLG